MTENKKEFEVGHYCVEKATNMLGVVLQNTGEGVRVCLQDYTLRTFKQGDVRWPDEDERARIALVIGGMMGVRYPNGK